MVARRWWLRGGRSSQRSCRRIGSSTPEEATTHVSLHTASQACQNCCVHAADTIQEAGNEQAEALASGEAKWQERRRVDALH